MLVCPNNTGYQANSHSIHEHAAWRSAQSSIVANLAEELGLVLLVPVFPRFEESRGGYTQALGRNTFTTPEMELRRPDLQLLAMVEDAKSRLFEEGWTVADQFLMTGFSASAAFSNRFTVIHPNVVAAVAVGSPGGWPIAPLTSWEGNDLPYPLGISDLLDLSGCRFDPQQYAKVPQLLYLGAEDTNDMWSGRCDLCLQAQTLLGQIPVDRWPVAETIYSMSGADARFHIIENMGHFKTIQALSLVEEFFRQVLSQVEFSTSATIAREDAAAGWYNWQLSIGVARPSSHGTVWFAIPPTYALQRVISSSFRSEPDAVLYDSSYANEIACFNNYDMSARSLVHELQVELLNRTWQIDPATLGGYEDIPHEVAQYLQPSERIQSDHPEIIQAAEAIADGEENPYLLAEKLLQFIRRHRIRGTEPNPDALSVLRTHGGQCGAHAFLFVALARALDIPARPVSGIASLRLGVSSSVVGTSNGINGYHIWAEIYLPGYGWVPVDPTEQTLGRLSGDRVVLSIGADIRLPQGGPIVPWFHIPIAACAEWEDADFRQIGGPFCLLVGEGGVNVGDLHTQDCFDQLMSGGLSQGAGSREHPVLESSISIDGAAETDWKGIVPLTEDADWDRRPIAGSDISAMYVAVSQDKLCFRLDFANGDPDLSRVRYSIYLRPSSLPYSEGFSLHYESTHGASVLCPDGTSHTITAAARHVVEMALPLKLLENPYSLLVCGETRPPESSYADRYDETNWIIISLP